MILQNQRILHHDFLLAIKEHSEYTYEEYTQLLSMSRATIARHIKKQKGEHII